MGRGVWIGVGAAVAAGLYLATRPADEEAATNANQGPKPHPATKDGLAAEIEDLKNEGAKAVSAVKQGLDFFTGGGEGPSTPAKNVDASGYDDDQNDTGDGHLLAGRRYSRLSGACPCRRCRHARYQGS
jgi:hypothetical protein